MGCSSVMECLPICARFGDGSLAANNKATNKYKEASKPLPLREMVEGMNAPIPVFKIQFRNCNPTPLLGLCSQLDEELSVDISSVSC